MGDRKEKESWLFYTIILAKHLAVAESSFSRFTLERNITGLEQQLFCLWVGSSSYSLLLESVIYTLGLNCESQSFYSKGLFKGLHDPFVLLRVVKVSQL